MQAVYDNTENMMTIIMIIMMMMIIIITCIIPNILHGSLELLNLRTALMMMMMIRCIIPNITWNLELLNLRPAQCIHTYMQLQTAVTLNTCRIVKKFWQNGE